MDKFGVWNKNWSDELLTENIRLFVPVFIFTPFESNVNLFWELSWIRIPEFEVIIFDTPWEIYKLAVDELDIKLCSSDL